MRKLGRQVTLDTRDILVECTATDLGKARTVLATMCAMFCEHAAVPFEVEPVEVVDALGKSHGAPAGFFSEEETTSIRPQLG